MWKIPLPCLITRGYMWVYSSPKQDRNEIDHYSTGIVSFIFLGVARMCIPVTDLLRVHSFNPQFTNLSGTIFTGALIVWTGCVCFCVCSSWLDISFISQGSRYSPFWDLFGFDNLTGWSKEMGNLEADESSKLGPKWDGMFCQR